MKAEESKVSRRSFLTTAGGVAVGLGIARLPGTANAAEAQGLPWPYPSSRLDADAVSEAAYSLAKSGGCGYGSAQSIINALAQALPDPWGTLPSGMHGYANGGVVGWGTICGSLNGVLAVMGLLGVHGKLGNALMDYFCTTELPTSDWEGVTLVTSVSYSPLCHNSVSKWAAAQGVTVTDPFKGERCARLVGDVVFKAVELMNAYFVDKVTPPAWVPPESYAGCYECHTSGIIPSQHGKMDCLECHETIPAHGSRRKRKGNSGR